MLILIRHTNAVKPGSWKGSDEDRPLTDKGRKHFARVAALVTEQTDVDVILSSPSKRCMDTAAMLADESGASVEASADLKADADPNAAAAMLSARADKVVAVVTHEPMASSIAAALLGAPLPEKFHKGEAVALDRVAKGPDSFQWAILPKQGILVDTLEDLKAATAGGDER